MKESRDLGTPADQYEAGVAEILATVPRNPANAQRNSSLAMC